ncbi:hypothetical protein mRhiFer1_009755 [Rhinolophus ferrumequinum]|uniref:Uncharacterized protein n=1 Tax=Rhinolophus ferrumequinum TaxID=59479 RepID=A0A7J7ZDI6_RHIFE|nr:hypothetical protein mRhiFer1_009755 [Rhinolophus ferrumequinum]
MTSSICTVLSKSCSFSRIFPVPFQAASFLRPQSLLDGLGLPLSSCELRTRSVTDLGHSPRAAKPGPRATFLDRHPQPTGQPSSRAQILQAQRTAWEGASPGWSRGLQVGAAGGEPGRRGGERRHRGLELHSAQLRLQAARAQGEGPSPTLKLSGGRSPPECKRRGTACGSEIIARAEPAPLVAQVPPPARQPRSGTRLSRRAQVQPQNSLLQGTSEMDS